LQKKQQQLNDAELIKEVANNYMRSNVNRKDRLDAGTLEIFKPLKEKISDQKQV